MEANMNTKIKLGGLWVNKSKDGKEYMSGNFGTAKIMLFRNNYKTESNHPDWLLYVVENDKLNKQETGPEKVGKLNLSDTEDDIPF